MNWYKKHKDWGSLLKDLGNRKETLRTEASKKAALLGHFLDGWNSMNSCRCRKCGAYAKINGVYVDDDGKQFYGAAFDNECSVRFANESSHKWQEFKNPNPKDSVI